MYPCRTSLLDTGRSFFIAELLTAFNNLHKNTPDYLWQLISTGFALEHQVEIQHQEIV